MNITSQLLTFGMDRTLDAHFIGVDARLFSLWEEVVSLASTIVLSEDDDEMIWQFHTSGVYSSQSLYSVINFKGVTPMYVRAVWKLIVPPRVHFFLWLLSKIKLLTRENLDKRRKIDDMSCLFCMEKEIVNHLFFDCVVARKAWECISEVIGREVGVNYESIGMMWLCNKRFGIANVLTSAVCWGVRKLRNCLCFQDLPWLGMKQMWHHVLTMLRCWKVLIPLKMMAGYEEAIASLEQLVMKPERIMSSLVVPDGVQTHARQSMHVFQPH
jgi:hypothetical protein